MKKSHLQKLTEENQAAKLAFHTQLLKRRTEILSKYDATETNRNRRNGSVEYQNEGEIYNLTKRLIGCNLGRDLERNYSPAKGMMLQFRVNVVGSLGKINVNIPDNADAKEATAWFNEVWAKDCDFRDTVDWSTMLQNILASEIREGDLLALVDDNLIEDTGKLLTWESDQIVPVSETILKTSQKTADYRQVNKEGKITLPTQDNGILRDKWGRVLAYSVTGKRGISVIDKDDDVTFWKRDLARLIRNPWRLNQGRGIPSLLTPSSNFIDLYEILASELQSAKRAAKQYGYVKRENATTDWDSPATGPEWLPENDGRLAADVAADGANQTTHTAKNYEKLESFTGGLTDYLESGDVVEFPKTDRPNAQLAAFLEAVHGYGGAALGLARVYTTLAASTSYTAYRGEQLMTWATFYWLQKHLERSVADWVARKVLSWAQRKKEIPILPQKWERSLSWSWPIMPEVNPLDYENSVAMSLKNGTTDYSELLGPDWRQRLNALSEQIEFIREMELPLSVLEAKSGGAAPGDKNINKEESATNEEGQDK